MKGKDELVSVIKALRQALAFCERLENLPGPIDDQIRELLTDLPNGLTTKGICRFVHRRRQEVIRTIRLMAAAKQITRNAQRLWVLVED